MRILLLLLSFLLFLSGCSENTEKENIELYEVKSYSEDIYTGIVKFQHVSHLSFQEDGVIIYNPYTKGDYVKKGQLLAKIDDTLYQIKRNEELAMLSELQVKYNRAKNYYTRINTLHKAGAISDNEWEEAEFDTTARLKEIYLQKEKLNYTNKQLLYTKLVSPYNGFILEKTGEVGEFVSSGKSVLTVVNSSETQVEIMVSPDIVNKIKLNDDVILKKDNITYKGKISHISQSSNNSGGFLIKISLDKFYAELKEGMSIDAVISKLNKNKIFVPLYAIFEENKKSCVFKVEKTDDNTFSVKKIEITTGKIKDEMQEVLNGLKNGDTIILKGQSSVKDGSEIKI